MGKRLLNFDNWSKMNESDYLDNLQFSGNDEKLMEAEKPISTSIWKGKPMEKYEKYFRYWRDIMRSKVKFEVKDVPMAKGGKYEASDECYVTKSLSQKEGGKDTTTFTLYSGNGTYYVVKVGEEGRKDPLGTLKKMIVDDKNLEQSGKYSFKKSGGKLDIDHVEKNKSVSYSFDMLSKLIKGWDQQDCYWSKDNPFLSKNSYPTNDAKMKAANEFRAFVKSKFPSVSDELKLDASRKDSSAYCSKNVMKAWNYISPESNFALGQIFNLRKEEGFDAAFSGNANDFNKWMKETGDKRESKPGQDVKSSAIVYNIPGDKVYDYKFEDGNWLVKKKEDEDWKSLSSNKAAIDKLNKQFPNASVA